MTTDELKRSLERAIFWLGVFALSYLILGFILKSDWFKTIDLAVFYEVLKDTFALTAALLAPIVAFLLFTDWRKQHRLVKNENLSQEILSQLEEARQKILINFGLLSKPEIGK
ncbi:hypothetical protein ACMXYY_13995, partial [Acinetobacter courvalinii]